MGARFVEITKQEFEDALPKHRETHAPLWQYAGFVDGEHTYYVPLPRDQNTGVMIRSSIGRDGTNADVGEDSIRGWLVEKRRSIAGDVFAPLGAKTQKWITRTSGWDRRLLAMIRTLLTWRLRAGDCPVCNKPKRIFVTKKPGKNKDRPFAKCAQHSGFVWLDEKPGRNPFFASPNVSADIEETETETEEENPTLTNTTRSRLRSMRPSASWLDLEAARRSSSRNASRF